MQVGVDVGGTKIEAALIEDLNILRKVKRKTEAEKGKEAVLKNIVASINEVFSPSVTAIGVGIAGPTNPDKGVLLESPHIPCLVNFPLRDFLEKEFKAKVVVDNDARMFTLGEYDLYRKNMVGLTLGTGIGGAAVVDDVMEANPKTAGEEIGHLKIVENGRRCSCGARGCLEAYASGSAIEKRYREFAGKKLTAKEIAEKAAKGNKVAGKVVEEAGKYLGRGLVKILERHSPDVIVIGGSVSNTIGLIETAIEEFKKIKPEAKVRIEKSKMRNAALSGAALRSRQV